MSCLRRTEGNQREADYLLDGTWFEYYWRLAMFNQYVRQVKEEMEKASKK